MTIRYDPELLDALDSAVRKPFMGTAWRHMFNDYQPARTNLRARTAAELVGIRGTYQRSIHLFLAWAH